ncbi:prepilin peptidase [Dellaglioa sp. BT-FLS60]
MLISYLFLLGACLGSFITCIATRCALNQSQLGQRSMCDYCGAEILWRDLIPIYTYLRLHGCCRFCKGRFPAYSFIFECSLAFMLPVTFIQLPLPNFLLIVTFLFYLTFLSVMDFTNRLISSRLTIGGGILLITWHYLLLGFPDAIITILFFSLFLFILCFQQKLGLGDFILLLVIQLTFGVHFCLIVTLSACISSLIYFLCAKQTRHQAFAFVPHLTLGTYLTIILSFLI